MLREQRFGVKARRLPSEDGGLFVFYVAEILAQRQTEPSSMGARAIFDRSRHLIRACEKSVCRAAYFPATWRPR
jgi:hypothetical protein